MPRLHVARPSDFRRLPEREKDSFLTAAELAGILKVTPDHIYRLTRKGRLPVLKLGATVRYYWPDILAALPSFRRGGPDTAAPAPPTAQA